MPVAAGGPLKGASPLVGELGDFVGDLIGDGIITVGSTGDDAPPVGATDGYRCDSSIHGTTVPVGACVAAGGSVLIGTAVIVGAAVTAGGSVLVGAAVIVGAAVTVEPV